MRQSIESHGMFQAEPQNQGLWNFLDNKQASSKQTNDLLKHRDIGQSSFEYYVTTKLLKKPSTNPPSRRKRLCTFSVTKTEKKRIKQIEKERKISQRFLKRQLSWLAQHGGDQANPDMIFGPVSVLPKALVDANGLPYKSSKSNTTAFLQNRYKEVPIIVEALPPTWTPHSAILEGMFMIQTPPLPTMSLMKDYVKLLLAKHINPHLRAGATEVHVVFDNPGSLTETPKEIEHRRRDKNDNDHKCTSFESNQPTPRNWRSILGCRDCKKKLTAYLGSEILEVGTKQLKTNQKLFTNIGDIQLSI